jgi:hypothetical protein
MYLIRDGRSDYFYFTRAFMWQSLFIFSFGIGLYGVISSTFKDCNMATNAAPQPPQPE